MCWGATMILQGLGTLQTFFRRAFYVLASCLLLTAPTAAQNTLQSNMRTDNVYDGVTYGQLLQLFSNTEFNGAPFTIVERGAPGRSPYFSLTSPQLPFAIYVGGAEEGYSGEGDGVYAGFVLFTTLNLNNFTQADINNFNFQTKFVKFSPDQTSGVYSVEALAAGGVSSQAMVSTLLPFFGGFSRLLSIASAQNTISFESDGLDGARLVQTEGRFNIVLDNPPQTATKISTYSPDNIAAERLIEDFAETAAHGRR